MDGADRRLGYPVKEGEEERGAGKESGERQRRKLEEDRRGRRNLVAFSCGRDLTTCP